MLSDFSFTYVSAFFFLSSLSAFASFFSAIVLFFFAPLPLPALRDRKRSLYKITERFGSHEIEMKRNLSATAGQ